MSESTLWWIVAGFLVSLELLTGSFYLLMLALGASAAAVTAMLGVDQDIQLALAAIVGTAAVLIWHRILLRRGRLRDEEDYTTSGLGHLDIGEKVTVTDWSADGTTRVHYRGTDWLARYHGTHVPGAGLHRICAIESNYLVLEPV